MELSGVMGENSAAYSSSLIVGESGSGAFTELPKVAYKSIKPRASLKLLFFYITRLELQPLGWNTVGSLLCLLSKLCSLSCSCGFSC